MVNRIQDDVRMKAISHCRPAVVFAGFLWAATIACAGPDQAQTSTKPDAATPPQTEVQAAQNTPKKKPVKSGAWQHFGERDSASVAGQSQPGVWHPFGPNHGTPKVVPGETTPRQEFGANRMADLERQMWALVNRDRLDPATAWIPRPPPRLVAARSPSGGTRHWLRSRERIPATCSSNDSLTMLTGRAGPFRRE